MEKFGATDASARQIIESACAEDNPTPYVEPVELDPALNRALEDIIRDVPETSEEQ